MINTSFSLLATVAQNSRMIRVWDAFGRQSTGSCVQIVRQDAVNLRSLCSSRSFLFATADIHRFDDPTDSQRSLVGGVYEPRDINVWQLCPSLIPVVTNSTLKSPPGLAIIDKAVKSKLDHHCFSHAPDLVILPQSSLLVSSHYDGIINIWKYNDDIAAGQEGCVEGGAAKQPVAVHLRTFLISRDHDYEFRFLLASQTSPAVVYLANMITLIAIDLSSIATAADGDDANAAITNNSYMSTDEGRDKGGVFVRKELGDRSKLLNCFSCGKWNVDHSSFCGGCKYVFVV